MLPHFLLTNPPFPPLLKGGEGGLFWNIYSAPWAWQASSITFNPYFLDNSKIGFMSADCPYICTGIIAFVFELIFPSMSDLSIVYVTGSISTKTGFAPVWAIASTVAKKVLGEVITSLPFPT